MAEKSQKTLNNELITSVISSGRAKNYSNTRERKQERNAINDNIIFDIIMSGNATYDPYGGDKTSRIQHINDMLGKQRNDTEETLNRDSSNKENSLFGKTINSSFENIPKYQEKKTDYRNKQLSDFKNKYGVDVSEFDDIQMSKFAQQNDLKYGMNYQSGESIPYITRSDGKSIAKNTELRDEAYALYALSRNNETRKNLKNKSSISDAAGHAYINSLSFGLMDANSDKIDKLSEKGNSDYKYIRLLSEENRPSSSDMFNKLKEDRPVAANIGAGAGELTKMLALKGLYSKAIGKSSWLSAKPEWITSAITDGLTFATINGANTAGSGGGAKDIARNTAIGAVGGSIGSMASYGVGALGENILFKTGLQHKLIPEIARNAVAAGSFSLADTASTYFLYPEQERPTAEEVAKNVAVSFAFAAISSALQSKSIKQESKQALDYVNEKMTSDYDNMLKACKVNDVDSVKKLAKNVVDYTTKMEEYIDGKGFKIENNSATSGTVREYLTGKTNKSYKADGGDRVLEKARFIGQSGKVENIKENLQTIRGKANEFLEKANSITTEPQRINNTDKAVQGTGVSNAPLVKSANINDIEKNITIKTDSNTQVNTTQTIAGKTQDSITEKHLSPAEMAKAVINENNSALKIKDISPQIKEINDILSNKELETTHIEKAWDIAENIGRSIAESSSIIESDLSDTYKELYNTLRTTPISISDTDKSDITGVDNFNEFRKNNFGNLKITNNGTRIDKFYQELSEQYPNFFDSQKETHPADQLMQIEKILQDIKKPLTRNLTEEEITSVGEDIALKIFNNATNNITLDFAKNQIEETKYIAADINTENNVNSVPRANTLTNSIAENMKKLHIYVPSDSSHITETNNYFLSDKHNLFDKNFVSRYAEDFVSGISDKNGSVYQQLTAATGDLTSELTDYVLTGESSLSRNNKFVQTANAFKSVLLDAVSKNAALHKNMYGGNSILDAQVQNIKNGDFSVMNVSEKSSVSNIENNVQNVDVLKAQSDIAPDVARQNVDIVNSPDNSNENTMISDLPIENSATSDIIKSKEDRNVKAQSIADFVKNKLANSEKITSNTLFKKASEIYGGTLSDNVFTVKDAYDAMELAVNQYILSSDGNITQEKISEIMELLPTQTKRTEGMDKYQQFSTPPTIAYYANYAANINSDDIMLEPSAGIGGIAVFAKKDGATVIVNELDPRRLSILKNMPFDRFYNENAEQINNILGNEIKPTVIVMNPPFSSSSERNIKNSKIGAKHIEEALKILAPNGRLVAITGKTMADNSPSFRTWWTDIKSKYNVVANIGISGKNYNKYGTNFGIQMLIIDKTGATVNTRTGYVENLSDLEEMLGGIRNERPQITAGNGGRLREISRTVDEQGTNRGLETGQRKESRARVQEDTTLQQTENTAARQNTSGEGTKISQSDNTVSDTSSNGYVGRQEVERDIDAKSNGNTGKSVLTEQQNTDVSNVSNTDIRSKTNASDQNIVGATGDVARKPDVRRRLKKKELTDSIFEQYQTQPLKIKGVQPHPARISESAAMSAIQPPKVTYKPSIPDDIIKNGILSDVQLEAITYAGQSHNQILPNKSARGFFVGDGTGVGKGRTLTGVILDNYMQGRKKAVWVTLNASLFRDMKRDVKALFGNSDLVHEFKGGKATEKSLNFSEGILAVSYDTMSKGWDSVNSNFEKLIKWLGEGFDGVIIFDEAHKMANSGKKGARGNIKPSQAALSGIELQKRLPKARVVYSSATGATEVENLRYAERLGLWGEGTAFFNGNDFVDKIKAGGLAAMELIARDMKAQGVYLSRNISYDDVKYSRITHKLTSAQRKVYDELAHSWQIVFQNMNEALSITNQENDGRAKQIAIGGFWSSQQRFFNQILTSMQVPSVLADMEKQLANGNSCVVQLVSTGEAADNKEFARLKEMGLELDDFDTTPRQMLMDYIEKCFPVQQFEEYYDDDGNKRSKPVFDSQGNPVINREALDKRNELLDKLGSISVPSAPIDMIIEKFGSEMVAENTGRSRRVEKKNGKAIEVKLTGKKDADVEAFQDGKKRIIIFSKAGGTGKSYHADLTAKNQQHRVHYLLEPGWRADDAVQGFGRSHRSNQASAPTFKLVTTDLKGQMRFVSTIAKRLDQLGALTKGQRQAGSQGMFSASDNLENGFASDVLAVFYKDLINNRVDGISDGMSIIEKLGLKNKILDDNGNIRSTAPEVREVNKFLNRILCLDSIEQNTVFDGYSERLEEATELAAQSGTLDKGLENYKADKISVNETKDIRIDETSGAATKYYSLTAQNKVKPVDISNIPVDKSNFLGYYKNKNTGALRAAFKGTSRTDEYGNITQNVKMYSQTQQKNGRPKYEYQALEKLNNNWEKITDLSKAKKMWNDEIDKLPEYTTENIHLISGVVLPVWDKLPTENVRIYRVLTDKGDMLIGRVIPEKLIDSTLKRMGANRTKEAVKTTDLIQRIKQGDIVYLDNGWKIKQSRVSGEQRIEILGASYEYMDMLKKKGAFTERIAYATRFFVPANTNTENVLNEILKISPAVQIENSEINYNKNQSNLELWERSNQRAFDNIISYTDHERTNWENSKHIIMYENDAQLLNFIDEALQVQSGKKIYFGKISKSLSDKIYDAVGLETENCNLSIKDYEIKKILVNSHGSKKIENMRGQEVISKNDLLSIPYIVENADEIRLSEKLYEGKPVIEFYKNENNKKVLIAYLSKKHKDLAVQTMYQSKKSLATADDVQASSFTSKTTRGTAHNNIISQKKEKSNPNINNSLNNYADSELDWRGDNNNQGTKKLYDIVSYVSKTFEVPISTGNLHNKKAKGEYKNFENSIRIKIANDLPTVTHELGHLLDKKYHLRETDNIDEALDFAEQNNPTLMKLYKPKERLNEAVAEFVREYLKNPKKMQKEVPNFYNDFINSLDDGDTEALKQVSAYVQDYFNSGFSERVAAAVITKDEMKRIEKGSMQDKTKRLYTKIVDDFAPINDAVKYVEETTGLDYRGNRNAYTLAINSRNSDAIASFILKSGMADANGNIVEGKSFIDCIAAIKPQNIKDFDHYLILKHSLEWLEPTDGKVKRVFADDSLQDVKRIKEEIDVYENKYPEYKTAAEDIYEYQRKILKYWVVDCGGMNEELFKDLQEKYPCYVPFKRYVGKSKGGIKSTFANQSTPISRAKGSGAAIISPIESIMQNTSRFIKFGLRNRVMGQLSSYEKEIEGFSKFMEEIPPDKIRRSIGIVPQIEKLKNVMSSLENDDFLELTEAIDDIFGDKVVSYTPIVKAGKQIVTYMDKGKYRYFQIHDKSLYDAVANMSPKQLDSMKFWAKSLNATNVLITQFNYLFGLKNPIRDFDTAIKHSKAYNTPTEFIAAYAAALKHIITNSIEYRQYQAAGGGHMSNFSDNINIIQKTLHDISKQDMNKAKKIAYSIFVHPIETLTRFNEITDTIPRLAEFEGMKRKGADNNEAIYEAADVTVNFNRSGNTGRMLNKIFRFSNAQIQGIDKEVRTFLNGGKNSVMKYVIRYAISALMTGALLEFWNRLTDEDGWEELSNYQKNNFYCVAIGDGHFIKIPKAREAAILNSLVERTTDFVFGDREAFYQFGEYIGDTIMPPWLPLSAFVTGALEGGLEEGIESAAHQVAGSTVFGGVVDNMVNEDFKGTPIVSQSLEGEPKKKQTNNKTTWLAYAIGQLTNTSPLKADHLIDSYTGILAKLNRAFGVMDTSQMDKSAGLKNTFVTDSAYSTDTFNKVYERRDKLKQKMMNNPTAQNACLYEKYAYVSSYVTRSNKLIRSLEEEEQRAAKQSLIDDVKNMDMSISDIDKSIANSFEGDVDDSYCIKNLPKAELSYTKKGKSYSYTLTYDEYRDYANDYIQEVNNQRKRLASKTTYLKATDNEKMDMLKKINSEAATEIKNKYKKRYKSKFERE